MSETLVGFDSAWTDNPRKPGAICALILSGGRVVQEHLPVLSTFNQALDHLSVWSAGATYVLIALDQPTIVPNLSGSRPAERVSASVISWLGGGVQPSNRSRTGMFDDAAPLWRFLASCAASDDFEAARCAQAGRFIIEVFPALSLPALSPLFWGRRAGPRYNPERKTFRLADWIAVCLASAEALERMGARHMAALCHAYSRLDRPGKADQDRLDSMLCLIIAYGYRYGAEGEACIMGSRTQGYIVALCSAEMRQRLALAASERDVPFQTITGLPAVPKPRSVLSSP